MAETRTERASCKVILSFVTSCTHIFNKQVTPSAHLFCHRLIKPLRRT